MVGGGVAGLSAALKLGRLGHAVTLIERDQTEMPETPDAAFEWRRRGAPQVRHSHAFLGRLRTSLARNEPDVLGALLDAGATEMRFGDNLPPAMTNFVPEPSDDELVMLACRRTTFEWVLRRMALDEGNITFEGGRAVVGLLSAGDAPVVTGVRFDGGATLDSDLVVVAAGRRSALPEWLAELGVALPDEEVEDTGIVYFSRFFRLRDGEDYPPRSGLIGGDLGYVKYGVFVGDNRTFSLTLAAPTVDDELRKSLADPVRFDNAARGLVVAAPFLDGRAEPLDDEVHVMAGLLNRWQDFVVDGEPAALGVIAIGDATLCTNPLYGRGCSTGYWGAQLLADAIEDHADLRTIALAYDEALRREILPWYRSTVVQDAEARRVAAALLAGEDPDGDETDPRTMMRAVFRDGLAPALQTDAVVLRAFMRNLNLLSDPDALMSDTDVSARCPRGVGTAPRSTRARPDGPGEPRRVPRRRHRLISRRRAPTPGSQSTASRSTTNTSVSFGAITPPAPDAP